MSDSKKEKDRLKDRQAENEAEINDEKEKRAEKAARKRKASTRWLIIGILLVVILFVIASFYFLPKAYDRAYQSSYDKAFEKYEEKYHVSNRAKITIEKIQEINKLEVLNLSDSYVIVSDKEKDNEKVSRCVVFTGTGTYTVDLSKSEFITDNERNHITVKLESPALSSDNIVLEHEVIAAKNEKSFLNINGNASEGYKLQDQDKKEAQKKIREQLATDENKEAAKESAEKFIRNLLKEINPQRNLKDEDIDIEFTDSESENENAE